MSGEQKAMVDIIIATPVDVMTEKERVRFAMMAAAYAGVALQRGFDCRGRSDQQLLDPH